MSLTSTVSYSFVAKKDVEKPVPEVLRSESPVKDGSDAVQFDILKGSLSANNKFYWSFGNNPPFNFFKCYPIISQTSKMAKKADEINSSETDDLSKYVHPVVWGIAQVSKSQIDGVSIGTKYLAMLPMGETVSFAKAHIDKGDSNKLVIDRPDTLEAYNAFNKIDDDDPMASPQYSDLALACYPGIVTGFGLYHKMVHTNCYNADSIVITSASSKVALATALFVKNDKENFGTTKVIGYTSEKNKEFCLSTGLYDDVLGYDQLLESDIKNRPPKTYTMIEISGRGDVYNRNQKNSKAKIVKLLAIGNAADVDDKKSTFAYFSTYATIKLMLTFMGIPIWIRSWMNPTQELFLILDYMVELKEKWGNEKIREKQKVYSRIFCQSAKDWISIRQCNTEESIATAFTDILEGSVSPAETIVLDPVQAVAHRK